MIVLKADPNDEVATGWTYSIAVSGQNLLVTTDVVEAVNRLEELGAEKPEDLVDQVRKRRLVEIRRQPGDERGYPPRTAAPLPRGSQPAKRLRRHSDKR